MRSVPALSRRAALALPLGLTGCGLFSGWFGEKKPPVPGKREPVLRAVDVLQPDPSLPRVMLPAPVANAAWLQAGGNPAHDMGHLAAPPALSVAWTADLGTGGGYRRKILTQPVVGNGVVYAMDSRADISALDLASGRVLWRTETRGKRDRSTNVGGGLGLADGVLYAVNGLEAALALDPGRGTIRWRVDIEAPGRSAPTIAAGRVFVTTLGDKLVALNASDGGRLWSYQAQSATTQMLGAAAPAFADGLVIAGFGSGELACLRAEGGSVVWSDTLAAAGPGTLADIASIRGNPAISAGRVFAMGMGGLTAALDLHAGRRLWERAVGGEDSPWIAGDWLFVVTLDQVLAALHAADGRVAWATPLPAFENPKEETGPLTWFGPILAGDRLVVAGTGGQALAVSPYTGQILGRQRLPASAAPVQPALAGGVVLLVAEDGRLIALR
ncbi:MAG TPA: PQQ-binding-like beta-propeller repeat protein [Acetobacteraceae bacterium]|nr:PQQ-binding-like beta-propeller repeat protein [Acetobacteraceae bacterium]